MQIAVLISGRSFKSSTIFDALIQPVIVGFEIVMNVLDCNFKVLSWTSR
jgi:hypothetical protein